MADTNSCCCGATKSKPCACMKKMAKTGGKMQCSPKEPMCACYKEKANLKKSFDIGWSIVKAKVPSFCPQCMSDELEIDTKEENLQAIKERRGGNYQYMSDSDLKRELMETMQGPDYWGYCVNCDYEFEG